LQIDLEGNSSTATKGRIAGFGGAPNMGCDTLGRRHFSYGWLKAGKERADALSSKFIRGRKLVVQIVETFQAAGKPTFVERLDAWDIQAQMGANLPPIMIYGDDISHIITEEGIANLLLCRNAQEREQAIRAIAGYTPVGLKKDNQMIAALRQRGAVQLPEDLGVSYKDAKRDLLAAKTIWDLVEISKGLYDPPKEFRNW
jgi:malonate decarboxylase alpha subunit